MNKLINRYWKNDIKYMGINAGIMVFMLFVYVFVVIKEVVKYFTWD